MSDSQYFTRADAFNLIGRQAKALADFGDVPAGTTGRVIRGNKVFHGPDTWIVCVEWDLPGRSQPPRNWFDANEYQRYVVTIIEGDE
jgi:hypothetical protein